jgi:FdhD protein
MARGKTVQMFVTKRDGGQFRRGPDELIVEEPMQIQLDGHLVSTTMRTPGHDFELAVGFLHGEGALPLDVAVTTVRYCGTGSAVETEFNVVTVETGARAPVPTARLGNVSSSCGLCGSTEIDQLTSRLSPLPTTPPFDVSVFEQVCDAVMDQQSLFAKTGAVHAAAAFDHQGVPLLVREDIGRHNAVDKVVGRLRLDGRLPAFGLGLFVSGRASFEMVQKAWAAGFAAVVAVSAPSSLAVQTARAANLTLAGFARPGRINLYAPDRPVG